MIINSCKASEIVSGFVYEVCGGTAGRGQGDG